MTVVEVPVSLFTNRDIALTASYSHRFLTNALTICAMKATLGLGEVKPKDLFPSAFLASS